MQRLLLVVLALAALVAAAPAALAQDSDPMVAAYGDFASLTFKGTGSKTIALPAGIRSGSLTLRDLGGGWVSADIPDHHAMQGLVAPDGLQKLVGRSEGTTVFGVTGPGDPRKKLAILTETSTVRWTVTIAPMRLLPVLALPTTGTTSAAYRYTGPMTSATASIKATGASPCSGTFSMLTADAANTSWRYLVTLGTCGQQPSAFSISGGTSTIIAVASQGYRWRFAAG